MKYSIYALFILTTLFVPMNIQADLDRVAARISGFTITAENLSRDLEKNSVTLSGKVEVTYKNQSFKADFVEIEQNKKQAVLRGHVQIFTQDYEIGGDEIRLDYESDQSVIFNGYVKSNNIQFHGELIEQESSQNFLISKADYSTCSNCPNSWSFSGSKIKAELGGYAFIKNTFLKVSGIPILWLPYLVVPLKNERQTGLLSPELGYINNRNLVLTESFFWAIDRSQDMTLTFKNYELGGLKEILEYRYAQSENTFGEFHASYINDTVFKSEPRYNYFRNVGEKENSFSRWALRGEQQIGFNEDTKAQVRINQLSDLQYPKDFFDEFKNYAESGLENRINISSKTDHSLFNFDAIYFKHLLEANPLNDNSAAVHKLPELRLDTQFKNWGDSIFYYKFNIDGTQFYRKKPYDDISVTTDGQKYVTNVSNNPACDKLLAEGRPASDCDHVQDGVFDENIDILRTGQRLNFKSTITTESATFSAINVTPQLSFQDSQYFFSEGSKKYNHKKLLQFDLLSRSKLYRIYESDLPEVASQKKYKHELIPEVTYTWIPWIDQEAHPFFGNYANGEIPFKSPDEIKDTDINSTSQNSLQFDTEDRNYERHIIKFSLLNRFIKKNIKESTYDPFLTFNLSQSYDLYQTEAKKNINKPLSNLDGTLNLSVDTFNFNQQIKYSPYESATDSTSTLTYQNLSGQYFKLGYVSNRINPSTKVDDLALAVGFVTTYLNLLTGVVIDTSENRTSDSRLKKHSLIAQFKPPGECWGINFFRDQKVGVGAEWKVRFDFSFDGKPAKTIPPDELKLSY